MKRKTLTLTICFLALISIVSIGFASWVISRPVADSFQAGSISAEAVNVDELSIELTWEGSTTIHYGKPNPVGDYTYNWLSNTSDLDENLSVTLEIKLDGNLSRISGLNLTMFIPETAEATSGPKLTELSHAFGRAYESEYITLPKVTIGDSTVTYDVNSGFSIDAGLFTESNSYTISVTFTFGWGTKFGGVNPLEHFNGMPHTEDNENAAKTALEAIYELQGLSYKVKVAPVLAS